jgi:hypothetical protein
MLRIADERGTVRNIPIGHWSGDIEDQLHRFTSPAEVNLAKPRQRHPSPEPLLIYSLLLIALASAFAWIIPD